MLRPDIPDPRPPLHAATPALPPAPNGARLDVHALHAGAGGAPVLRGVTFGAAAGACVVIDGRHGSGRSLLLRALVGQVPARGAVRVDGLDVLGWPGHRIARAGVGYVSETRDVFAALTVEQNLVLGLPGRWAGGQRAHPGRWTAVHGPRRSRQARIDAVFERLPLLAARRRVRAGVLSGGEQQLLALARATLAAPRVLLLDEVTEGLSAAMVACVAQWLRELADDGVALVLVDQNRALTDALAGALVLREFELCDGRLCLRERCPPPMR